jgi:5'-methylthioadenosine phosphorylase
VTFHEGGEKPVVHIDFTEPYDEPLRQRLLAAAERAGEGIVADGVYAATQGPRLETAAEINRLERDGADLVGMTAMPEASLARELDVPYASLCVVANWAAGRGDSARHISFERIEEVLQMSLGRARNIIEHLCAETG